MNYPENYFELKKKFGEKFQYLLIQNFEFKGFLYEVFYNGGSAYVVGGFLRDILFNKGSSRDIDIIINLPFNEIKQLLENSNLTYSINRMNGFKISLNNFESDIWSIEDNWAFKNNLVVKNEDYLLKSIANGCFYNYDSLVINIHNKNVNVAHFGDFIKNKKLDIIQKNTNYKNLNPAIEANILRAFYLKKKFSIGYSENCESYLESKIELLSIKYNSAFDRLKSIKKKYLKYDVELTDNEIYEMQKRFIKKPLQKELFLYK